MSNKILVTYASRASSTVGVAEAIGNTLIEHGLDVDILPMKDVYDLAQYSAVVAGSAIRFDKWLPEAMDFMERHQVALQQKPFASFLVCLAMAVKGEQRRERARKTASSYLKPVRELVNPVSEGLFAGVLDLSKLPLSLRIGFRVPILLGLFKEGDYRDWDAIRAWANNLPEKLTESPQRIEAILAI